MRRVSLASVGPAIIVASVVLGPGSILLSSRVGCDFAYDLMWVLIGSAVLMAGMTALSARLGVTLDRTPCDEVAQRAGRPLAAFVGLVLFLVVACFQFSNNVAIVAAVQSLVGKGDSWPVVLLVSLNLGVVCALFGLRRLYRPVELLMKSLVGLMIVGFACNLVFARPSLAGVLGGFIPRLPADVAGNLVPRAQEGGIHDPLLPVVGLISTTFSVAGAFYQAYLVRKKGWKASELDKGLVDSLIGIAVLGLLSLMVLMTAASVLHGRVEGSELESAADVAQQLAPLFGPHAKALFGIGLLAAAFSSLLVNVMIGGTVLSDGLGLGGDMDGRWPKVFTGLALLTGMIVALVVLPTGESPVQLVLVAQALTVLGNPVLAGVLLWLALYPRGGGARTPRWLVLLAVLGFLVVLVLALRTGVRVYLSVTS